MKMWCMRVIILLLFCYACLSIENGGVHFVSRNFNNTLYWDPAKPAFPGENVTYSVMYNSDAEEQPFQIKEACQNITALSCDLTAETPSIHDVHYMAEVLVNGRLHGITKNRLKPIADTTLGPPILSTYTTVTSLHVNVTLPLGPNGVSIADIITRSKNGPSKTVILYILKITHPEWAAQVNKTTTGRFTINLKNNQTKYCGYVIYKPSSEWGRSESENASFCVTLPGDPLMLLPWLLLTAALLAAIVLISAVCMCNYVKGGKEKSMPQKLVTTPSIPPRVLQSLDKNLIISKPVFQSPECDKTVYATIRMKPNVPSVGVGGYSPQDIPCQAWQESTGSSLGTGARSPTPNEGDTSAQSSEIYSVVAVQVPTEVKTSNLPLSPSGESWDKGGTSPKMTSDGVPPLHDPDAFDSNPAISLKTARGPDGRLLISLLTFESENSAGYTQRKPLLSDLIDSEREGPSLASLQSIDGSEGSDSGCDDSTINTPTQPYCNTHYFPSQPVISHPDFQQGRQNTPSSDAKFESGYKQNWMPEIFLGSESKDSCEYRRTNYHWTQAGSKKEEEGEEEEDREGEERPRQILLGGWVVQLQE